MRGSHNFSPHLGAPAPWILLLEGNAHLNCVMRTRRLFPLFLFSSLLICAQLWCQEQSASAALPDSPTPHIDMTNDAGQGTRPQAPNHHGYPTDREESWKALPKDFLHDQKLIWAVFPNQTAHGHHWVPILATVGATAGLLY